MNKPRILPSAHNADKLDFAGEKLIFSLSGRWSANFSANQPHSLPSLSAPQFHDTNHENDMLCILSVMPVMFALWFCRQSVMYRLLVRLISNYNERAHYRHSCLKRRLHYQYFIKAVWILYMHVYILLYQSIDNIF
jgi:hypothetical protein